MPLLDNNNGITTLKGNEYLEIYRPHETKYVTPGQLLAAANVANVLTGTTPLIDWNLGNIFTLLLSGNTTVAFANSTDGREIKVFVTNTTGNFTVTWPNTVKWPGGTAPMVSTGAHTDVYTFRQIAGVIYGSAQQNF